METRKIFWGPTKDGNVAFFVPEPNRQEAQKMMQLFVEDYTDKESKELGDIILGHAKDITGPWIMYPFNPTFSFIEEIEVPHVIIGYVDISKKELSRIPSVYISKVRKIMKRAGKMWKIPNVEAVYIGKEDRPKFFRSILTQDALAFVIATDGYLKVGDKVGAWKVVNVSNDKKVAKLSNGKKDFTVELWFKCKSKGRVKFCWVNHIRMDLYEIKTTDEVIEKDMLS